MRNPIKVNALFIFQGQSSNVVKLSLMSIKTARQDKNTLLETPKITIAYLLEVPLRN